MKNNLKDFGNSKELPITELHISDTLVELSKYSRFISFKVHRLLIRRTRNKFQKYDHLNPPDLSNTKKLKITIPNGEISLDEEKLKRLKEYIKNESNIEESDLMNGEYFDCGNFAEYICGKTSQGDKFDLSRYNKKDLNTDELKGGEIILLGNKINLDNLNLKGLIHFWLRGIFEFDEEHVMIYIGNGLYISKASDEYGIIVGELGELKKLYDSNDALLLERKLKTILIV